MPEPTIITSLDDFYEKFGYVDQVDRLNFIEELEATPPVTFVVGDEVADS